MAGLEEHIDLSGQFPKLLAVDATASGTNDARVGCHEDEVSGVWAFAIFQLWKFRQIVDFYISVGAQKVGLFGVVVAYARVDAHALRRQSPELRVTRDEGRETISGRAFPIFRRVLADQNVHAYASAVHKVAYAHLPTLFVRGRINGRFVAVDLGPTGFVSREFDGRRALDSALFPLAQLVHDIL